MKTKYVVGVVLVLLVAGGLLAFNMTTGTVRADDTEIIESDCCCITGDCCCPGQGSCCDPAARAKVAGKVVVKKGPGCCATDNCCCPGNGSCCAASGKAGSFICPITGEELACPNCCPLNKK